MKGNPYIKQILYQKRDNAIDCLDFIEDSWIVES